MDKQKPAVMIVDDEPIIRELVSRIVNNYYDVEVLIEKDGKYALKTIEQREEQGLPNLVCLITDNNMDMMDGTDLIKRLREKNHRYLITLMSGLATEKDKQESGADYLLPKPFTMPQLKETLDNMLADYQKKINSP